MISLTENQRSEPITQICRIIYRMGFYLPSVKSVCIDCVLQRKGQMFESGISHTRREEEKNLNGIVVQQTISGKVINIKSISKAN